MSEMAIFRQSVTSRAAKEEQLSSIYCVHIMREL